MPTFTPTSPPQPGASPTTPASCQAIVFQIAQRWFAIPPTTLLRVVHKTALHKQVDSDQLIYLGKQPLPILDLRPLFLLAPKEQLSPPAQPHPVSLLPEAQFFVIAAVDTTVVGIPVDQAPILLELPLAASQPVPPAYYNAIGGMASHVVVVPQLGSVLLLNLSTVSQGIL